jgi:hypothetical protein
LLLLTSANVAGGWERLLQEALPQDPRAAEGLQGCEPGGLARYVRPENFKPEEWEGYQKWGMDKLGWMVLVRAAETRKHDDTRKNLPQLRRAIYETSRITRLHRPVREVRGGGG